MKRFLLLAYINVVALVVTGCSTGTGSDSTARLAANVQADWAIVKAAAGVYVASAGADPKVTVVIQKAESVIDPAVAGLSGLSAPTTIKAAIADISSLMINLPPGTIDAKQQADLTFALSLLSAAASFTPPSN